MSQTSVLIVEDDENIRALYADALNMAQMVVHTASTGAEGVSIALKEHPTVILMDIRLPDMLGHEAVEKIRLDSWGKHAKVIFLTNMTDAENISAAVAAGSAEYIVKVHTTPKEVVNMVRTVSHLE